MQEYVWLKLIKLIKFVGVEFTLTGVNYIVISRMSRRTIPNSPNSLINLIEIKLE